MSECTSLEFRDQLPDLLHGSLGPDAEVLLRSHLVSCEQCREELELLELGAAAIAIDTPPVNLAPIVAAMSAAAGRETDQLSATVQVRRIHAERSASGRTSGDQSFGKMPSVFQKRSATRRRLGTVAALAAVLALAAIGTWNAVTSDSGSSQQVAAEVAPTSGLNFSSTLSDLSDEALLALLDDLDSLEPLPAAEPDPGQGSFTGIGGD